MNELTSKLFKTFFRSKKYFLRKKLELGKVISKTENFRGNLIDFEEVLMIKCPKLRHRWHSPDIPNTQHLKCFNFCAIFFGCADWFPELYIWLCMTLLGLMWPEIRIFNDFTYKTDFLMCFGAQCCQIPITLWVRTLYEVGFRYVLGMCRTPRWLKTHQKYFLR